jgi:uncharacterized damage-inducible protein DinB
MKVRGAFVCSAMAVLLGVPTATAPAQTTTASSSTANPISQAIRDGWTGAKRNITESAEQMPEADYAFKPTEQVRTFGAILAHIAGVNYIYCASAKGEKSQFEEDQFEKSAKTRADIIKALNESLAYCDEAFNAVTDRSAAEMVPRPFGSGTQARAAALMANTAHLQEHYGNLVTYFRIKGMVPPSSRRQ